MERQIEGDGDQPSTQQEEIPEIDSCMQFALHGICMGISKRILERRAAHPAGLIHGRDPITAQPSSVMVNTEYDYPGQEEVDDLVRLALSLAGDTENPEDTYKRILNYMIQLISRQTTLGLRQDILERARKKGEESYNKAHEEAMQDAAIYADAMRQGFEELEIFNPPAHLLHANTVSL